MNIISNFKDYYDNVDSTTSTSFIRNQVRIDSTNFAMGIRPRGMEDLDFPDTTIWLKNSDCYSLFFLYFCDEVYPFIFNMVKKKAYYSVEELPADFFRNCNLDTYAWNNEWSITNKFYHITRETAMEKPEIRKLKVLDLFKHFEDKSKEWNFNSRLGVPIFYEYATKTSGTRSLYEKVINGSLESIGFDKILEPSAVIQKIDNWLTKKR